MAMLGSIYRTVPIALLLLGVGGVVMPFQRAVHAQQPSSNNKSWTDPITSPIKQGFDKMGKAFSSKPTATIPDDDPTSLKSKAKPGADLYVAIARLYLQNGKYGDADVQYQLALRENPNHLPALLGYAQLKDRLNKQDEAMQLYQRAMKAYPQDASVYNNLGIYHAKHQRLDDAVAMMKQAIQLDSQNPLYRNNIATVLVDQGKVEDAFIQLCAVHNEAEAHYNLGYLLNKKGQQQAALQQFVQAVNADPDMEAARNWVTYLHRTTSQARLSQHPMSNGVRVTTPPPRLPEAAPLPPDTSPQRLPPTSVVQPEVNGPALPGISYNRSTAPMAPLPPLTAEAVRPLPRVN